MRTPALPGFRDLTLHSQQTFRSLLEALARPGLPRPISLPLEPPAPLNLPCAAACLTLLDLETHLWLQPDLAPTVGDWLRFHTGTRCTDDPMAADFALIPKFCELVCELAFKQFSSGTPEVPEASATLLCQVDALIGGPAVTLSGPGIQEELVVSPTLPVSFWLQWQQNHCRYPQGLDVFLFDSQRVMGLPRTSQAQIA